MLAGLRSHQGPFPTFLSLLLPELRSVRRSPAPQPASVAALHALAWETQPPIPGALEASVAPRRCLTFLCGHVSRVDV